MKWGLSDGTNFRMIMPSYISTLRRVPKKCWWSVSLWMTNCLLLLWPMGLLSRSILKSSGLFSPFFKSRLHFLFLFFFFQIGVFLLFFFYYYYYYDFRIGLSGWIFLAVLRTMSLKMGVPIILGSSRIWISSWRLWIRRFCRNWMVHLINPPGNKLSWYWILLLQLLYTRETRNILGKHLVYMIWCGTYFKENYQKDWYMSHLKSHLQCINHAVQCTGYITHTIKPDYF